MLLSSKNVLTEAPSMFDQIIKHPVAQSNWHIKIAIQKKKKTSFPPTLNFSKKLITKDKSPQQNIKRLALFLDKGAVWSASELRAQTY